jgi:hypothetical protein
MCVQSDWLIATLAENYGFSRRYRLLAIQNRRNAESKWFVDLLIFTFGLTIHSTSNYFGIPDEYDPQTRAWGYRVYCTGLSANIDAVASSPLHQLRTSTALALSACARVSVLLTKSAKTTLDSAVLSAPFLAAPAVSFVAPLKLGAICENQFPARLNSNLSNAGKPYDAELVEVFELLPSNVQSFWAEKESQTSASSLSALLSVPVLVKRDEDTAATVQVRV